MEVTEKLINQIRRLLVDTDEDEQLFTDEELIEICENCESKNQALYIAYIQKASKLISPENCIKSIEAGREKITRLDATSLSELAYKQAEIYRNLWQEERKAKEGSTFLYS